MSKMCIPTTGDDRRAPVILCELARSPEAVPTSHELVSMPASLELSERNQIAMIAAKKVRQMWGIRRRFVLTMSYIMYNLKIII